MVEETSAHRKIAILTDGYSSGGTDVFICTLINNWPAEDEFVIICNYDHPAIDDIFKRRLRRQCKLIRHSLLTSVQLSNWCDRHQIVGPFKAFFRIARYVIDMGELVFLTRLLNNLELDRLIISSGGYPNGNICRIAAILGLFAPRWGKALFVYHNGVDPVPNFFLERWAENLYDLLVERGCGSLVTVSKDTRKKMKCRPFVHRSQKHKIIPYGIELPTVTHINTTVREELAIPPEHKILVMLGMYEERKGYPFLLKAFRRVKDVLFNVTLITAGAGPQQERDKVVRLARGYGLVDGVRVLGFREDALSLVRQADLLVVPSQNHESFGLTIVEALLLRVPVVATRIGGIPEVLEDGCGGFTTSLDSDEFARRILELLQQPELRQRVIEKGYQMARSKFDVARMVNEYRELL